MAIIDVVRWDASPDLFAWKFPENNLSTYTQLIVNESQEAILFHKGKIVLKAGPGKHVLNTENFPVLRNLYGIPFGGQNPFTAEVWFINKIVSLDIKWGTRQPFHVRDPEFKIMVPIRANGQFGIQIKDSETFLVKLVGTMPYFEKSKIVEYFKGMFLSRVTPAIAKKINDDKISILELATLNLEISNYLHQQLQKDFDLYGIDLVNFYVNNMSFPEDDRSVIRLRDMLSRKAEMENLGFDYQQERSFDVLENTSKNRGMVGGLMGAGMGMGLGFGMGGGMANMSQELLNNINKKFISCPNCKKPVDNTSKFCSHCATSLTPNKTAAIYCDKCNQPLVAGAKFCPNCGDPYNPCLKCGADLPKNAKSCPTCGEPLPKNCTQCNTEVMATAQFCSQCGNKL